MLSPESSDFQGKLGEHCDGKGYSRMLVGALDYLSAGQLLVYKSICRRLSRGFRQVQTFATVFIPIDYSSEPVNGKCPGPLLSDSCCKYFDYPTFIFQSFHVFLN